MCSESCECPLRSGLTNSGPYSSSTNFTISTLLPKEMLSPIPVPPSDDRASSCPLLWPLSGPSSRCPSPNSRASRDAKGSACLLSREQSVFTLCDTIPVQGLGLDGHFEGGTFITSYEKPLGLAAIFPVLVGKQYSPYIMAGVYDICGEAAQRPH